MELLSDEIIINICMFLDVSSIVTLSEVSKYFNALTKDFEIWKTHCNKLGINILFHNPPIDNGHIIYKEMLLLGRCFNSLDIYKSNFFIYRGIIDIRGTTFLQFEPVKSVHIDKSYGILNVSNEIPQLNSLFALDAQINFPQCLIDINQMRLLRTEINSIPLMPKLKFLQLSNCKNKSFPAFPSLLELSINFSDLMSVPESIIESKSLMSLNLNNNRITSIPGSIASLSNLRFINLSCNRLKDFPLEIVKMQWLRSLDLSNNKIENIPSLEKLIVLLHLDISNNKITELHTSIFGLKCLGTLFIQNNLLTEIPNRTSELINLKHFSYFGNPLIKPFNKNELNKNINVASFKKL